MISLQYLPEECMFPLVKKAVHFDTEKAGMSGQIPLRTAKNFELSFFDSGSGVFYIDGIENEIRPGAVRFVRPGQTVHSTAPYSCFSIFFDLVDFSVGNDGCTSGNGVSTQKPSTDNTRSNEVLDSFPCFFYTAGNQKNAFSEAVQLFYQSGTGSIFRQNALLMQILSSYYYVTVWQKGRSPVVQKCVEYIQKNYAQKITLEHLSQISNYSALHIRRKFLSEMGISPNDFLLSVRLTNAKKLLEETAMSVGTISANCGFSSEAYFYSAFRAEIGITPGKYRETMRSSLLLKNGAAYNRS